MELEGSKLSIEAVNGAPILMPWKDFASWIGTKEWVVQNWIRQGYIPRIKIGTRVMVNVALLNKRLLESESI